jgi:alpha-tubulin suppressor-like RCC1 family protein
VQLKDGVTLKWGGLEAVRIIAGQLSSGAFPLTANPGSIGDIELIINPDLQNPITITFSGQEEEIPVGSEMTISATTSEPVDSYQWYINGTLLTSETGPSITIGSSLAPGVYRLDLVVTNGNIISTGYIVFTVGSAQAGAVIALAAGSYHSLALKSDGTVWAWGNNYEGQLGNGTNTDSLRPVQVSNLTHITAIAAGDFHNLALKDDGTVWAWGYNRFGALGDGTTQDKNLPVQVSNLTNVRAIFTGDYYSLAIKDDGKAWAWGHSLYGELGNGTATDMYLPVQVSNLTDVTFLSGSMYHTMGLTGDGLVWSWGLNGYLFGNGTTSSSTVPVLTGNITNAATFACGDLHCIALKNDGTVWAWGKNEFGQLGDGTTVSISPLPVLVSNLTNISAISSKENHSLALKSDGTVWAWGLNDNGQLGNGTVANSNLPVQVSILTNVVLICSGVYHNLALTGDGQVWAWGWNEKGQFGDGTTTGSNAPVRVNGI